MFLPTFPVNIISSFKLSISMSLIGVISGEFLTSSSGIGYLIIYGTQVFNLDLVVSGIVILVILSSLLFCISHSMGSAAFRSNESSLLISSMSMIFSYRISLGVIADSPFFLTP